MTFTAPTREEALRLAEEYMNTIDPARQPWIDCDYPHENVHVIIVKERGLD